MHTRIISELLGLDSSFFCIQLRHGLSKDLLDEQSDESVHELGHYMSKKKNFSG